MRQKLSTDAENAPPDQSKAVASSSNAAVAPEVKMTVWSRDVVLKCRRTSSRVCSIARVVARLLGFCSLQGRCTSEGDEVESTHTLKLSYKHSLSVRQIAFDY